MPPRRPCTIPIVVAQPSAADEGRAGPLALDENSSTGGSSGDALAVPSEQH
jgi:hypothetical protein